MLHIIVKILASRPLVCPPGVDPPERRLRVLFLVLWVMPSPAVCFCQDSAQTSCSLFNLSLGPGLKSSPSFRYYSTLLSLSHPSFYVFLTSECLSPNFQKEKKKKISVCKFPLKIIYVFSGLLVCCQSKWILIGSCGSYLLHSSMLIRCLGWVRSVMWLQGMSSEFLGSIKLLPGERSREEGSHCCLWPDCTCSLAISSGGIALISE